jgi:hypothetical protein
MEASCSAPARLPAQGARHEHARRRHHGRRPARRAEDRARPRTARSWSRGWATTSPSSASAHQGRHRADPENPDFQTIVVPPTTELRARRPGRGADPQHHADVAASEPGQVAQGGQRRLTAVRWSSCPTSGRRWPPTCGAWASSTRPNCARATLAALPGAVPGQRQTPGPVRAGHLHGRHRLHARCRPHAVVALHRRSASRSTARSDPARGARPSGRLRHRSRPAPLPPRAVSRP